LSADTTDIHLCPATFVDLSADQERQAIEALAGLLVPFLTDPHRPLGNHGSDPITEAIGQTGPALFCSAAEQGPPCSLSDEMPGPPAGVKGRTRSERGA
jgi:hypothetical protein